MIRLCQFLLLLLPLAACNTVEKDWAVAQEIDTVSSYREFLRDSDLTDYDRTASARIEALELEAATQAVLELDWETAVAANTATGYGRFRGDHPDSVYEDSAVANTETVLWEAARESKKPDRLRGFLNSYPESSRAGEAIRLLEGLLWAKVDARPTLRGLERFLSEFPESEKADRALALTEAEDRRWQVSVGTPVKLRHEAITEGVTLSAMKLELERRELGGEASLDTFNCVAVLGDGSESALVALVVPALPDEVSAILRGRAFGGDIEMGDTVFEGRSNGAPYSGLLHVINIGGSLSIGNSGGISSDGDHQLEYHPSEDLERSAPLPKSEEEGGLLVTRFNWSEKYLADAESKAMLLLVNATRQGGAVFSLLPDEKLQLFLVFAQEPSDIRGVRLLGRTVDFNE
jgi:hypothetical protein